MEIHMGTWDYIIFNKENSNYGPVDFLNMILNFLGCRKAALFDIPEPAV